MKGIGRELARERATAYKRSLREKLRALRAELVDARAAQRAAIVDAKAKCREDRIAVRERLKAQRAELIAELRKNAADARRAARETCALSKSAARSHGRASKASTALRAEREYQAELKRIELGNRAQRIGLAKASVRRSESDDEVRSNIAPELVPLFERVKKSIRATGRKSRTEAFLEYAESHPREYLAAIEDGTERAIRELEARAAQTARLARKRRYSAAELAEVPF